MKQYNFASRCLCLFAGVAFLTACDNENDFADPNNRDGKPLKIETSIAETRAVVTGTSFSEGDRVGLFVLDDGGQVYADNSMNQQATYNGTEWEMQSEITLSGEKTPYVFAVYPYYAGADYIPVDIDTRISIDIAPNRYDGIEGQADWMYANALPMEGNTAKLTFRHALARVTLQLKRGTDEQGDGLLSSVRMQNAMKYNASTNEEMGLGTELRTYGVMSLRDGIIEASEDQNANIELNTELGLSEEAQAIDILVIPTASTGELNTPVEGTTGGGIEVLLTIDGKQYRVDLGVPTWHAGQQYIYPITINRNSAEVTPDTPVAEAVDLGLSVKWASFNVGATAPEEYGGYYAWGETEEQELYSYQWITYKWCEGTGTSMTKYCTSNEYGTVDNKTILEPDDDVACAKWGDEWRMPTYAEFQELIEKCTWTWTEQNGTTGYIVSASNGNSIFLPAAGASGGQGIFKPGELGNYWISTLSTRCCMAAYAIFFTNTNYNDLSDPIRCNGLSVRPVYGPQITKPVEPELTPTEGAYVDLGLPSGTLWASCNVGANSPEEAGGYYAWGETNEKEDYSWGTYKWRPETSFTKYCTDSSYGTVDGKTTLEPEDDVAYMVLGSEWRMPTQTEIQELQEYCTWTLGEYKGCAGYLIEGSNGNCIFLPFAGAIYDNEHHYESEGYYWTATLRETSSGIFNYFNTNSKYYNLGYQRYYGMTVRPIYDPQPSTEPVAEAVDLGLSVKWASFNVGATAPEECGGYYAWGETEEKEDYSWETYKWCNGTETSMIKYCTSSDYGTIDGKTILDLEDDVAHVKWGGTWRIPTQAEIQELIEKCTWTQTEKNGIVGHVVSASNGNSIFLPATGFKSGSTIKSFGLYSYYCSSTLNENYSNSAYGLRVYGELDMNGGLYRRFGSSVRPVTE